MKKNNIGSEAATRGVPCKKMFLEISQSSQENTCARVSFLIKLQACNFIKKETLAQVFSCEFCEVSKKPFLQNCFYRLVDWISCLLPHKKVCAHLQIFIFHPHVVYKVKRIDISEG